MNAIGPDQAVFDVQQQLQDVPIVDMSQQMWDYKNRDTFEGLQLTDEAKNLMVNSAEELQKALQPVTASNVWTGYLSPEESDKKYVQKYAEIKEMQTQNLIQITSETVQFCPSLNKFLVLITYVKVRLGLNPRYKHLKENTNGE